MFLAHSKGPGRDWKMIKLHNVAVRFCVFGLETSSLVVAAEISTVVLLLVVVIIVVPWSSTATTAATVVSTVIVVWSAKVVEATIVL